MKNAKLAIGQCFITRNERLASLIPNSYGSQRSLFWHLKWFNHVWYFQIMCQNISGKRKEFWISLQFQILWFWENTNLFRPQFRDKIVVWMQLLTFCDPLNVVRMTIWFTLLVWRNLSHLRDSEHQRTVLRRKLHSVSSRQIKPNQVYCKPYKNILHRFGKYNSLLQSWCSMGNHKCHVFSWYTLYIIDSWNKLCPKSNNHRLAIYCRHIVHSNQGDRSTCGSLVNAGY
jgi:hypothetical protein